MIKIGDVQHLGVLRPERDDFLSNNRGMSISPTRSPTRGKSPIPNQIITPTCSPTKVKSPTRSPAKDSKASLPPVPPQSASPLVLPKSTNAGPCESLEDDWRQDGGNLEEDKQIEKTRGNSKGVNSSMDHGVILKMWPASHSSMSGSVQR
jgi:hypothetical protein